MRGAVDEMKRCTRSGAEQFEAVNQFVSKRGWRDETSAALEADKLKAGLSDRADITTFFDFYEVDEGRASL